MSDVDSTDSSPVDTPDSPQLSVPQISYPPPDEPSVSRFLDQQVNSSRINDCFSSNLGSLNADCLENIGASGAIHTFPSPIDSASSSSASMGEHLPIAGVVEGGEPQNQDVSSWAATGMGDFAVSFEVMDALPIYDCVNSSALDYSFDYEAFTFGGLSEEGSNMLADQYI